MINFSSIKKLRHNKVFWILALIVLLGFFLRLYHVTYPYLDHHSWRQTTTAMITDNLYNNNFNILRPEIDWRGNEESTISYELQITPFLTAILYFFLGIQDFVGRIMPIVFSLLSIIYLYKLINFYFDEKLALFVSFVYSILPLNIFFGRVLMPEAGMMFFTIAALFYFSIFIRNTSLKNLIVATIFISLAFLTKLTNLYLLIPLFFILISHYKSQIISNKKILLYTTILILVALGIALLYYTYIQNVATLKEIPKIGTKQGWGNIEIWSNSMFYKTLWQRGETIIFTQLGIFLFFIGLALHSLNKHKLIFFGWLGGIIFYILAIANANYVHSYYQMPLIPIGAFFIGLTLYKIYQAKYIKLLSFALSAILIYLSVFNALPMYGMYAYSALDAGNKLKQIDNSNSLVLSVPHRRDMMPEILYYANRKGWVIWPDQLSITEIEKYKNIGVKYIVMTEPYYFNQLGENLREYLQGKKAYLEDNFLILEI